MKNQPHCDRIVVNSEVFLISYFIGSLPTAYIVVKRKAHIDIRSAGSGNVGTLNAYEVTGARAVGLLVLCVDVMKGSAAVFFAFYFFGITSAALSGAMLGVVVGHCFPVWLKFRGGRGLAPAAGAMLAVAWIFVALWLACWSVGYLFSKNIHVGNLVAIIISPFLGAMIPEDVISKTTWSAFTSPQIVLVYSLMSIVLLIRHIEPLRTLLSSRKGGT
ncbi:MAG TPA: glycerol-3-phosphate acyltransferase [Bacteroidota bacterium]|nr:glycerol-3-phosphate acyltransferase [Bacteroidota bacterium]